MTLSTITVRTAYTGSGSPGPFSYPFKITAATDLEVRKTSVSGSVSLLSYPTDYSVTGIGDAAGGSITLTVSLATGEGLSILRAVPATQPASLRTAGTFLPGVHEDALDRAAMVDQQQQDTLGRALRVSPSLDPSLYQLALTPETGKALVWQSATQLGNSTIDSNGITVPGSGRTVATTSAYLLNNAVFNVKDFGADSSGATSSHVAIQAANDAAVLVGGGSIYFPNGSYLVSTIVTLGSKVALVGDGPGSILVGNIQSFISATSKTDILIQNLNIQTKNNRLLFTACARVSITDCFLNGLRSNGELTQQGIWSAGTVGLRIARCDFVDFRDNIYLADNSGAVSDQVAVMGCTFNRTTNGTTDNFTTGVYCFHVGSVIVSECLFKNLYPGDLSGSPFGYGVYEGDGVAQDVRVENCTCISTDAAKPFIGVGFYRATTGAVIGCTFRGGQGFDGASQYLRIANSTFDQSICVTKNSSGGPATYKVQQFIGNSFLNTTGTPLIVMNVGTPGLDLALVTNNYFFGATKGAIWFRFVTTAVCFGNTIIDCNTSNASNDFDRGGINYSGCIDGLLAGNFIANVGTGSMQYGIVSGATDHTINATDSNIIRNMTTGTFLRAFTGAPTIGRHDKGERWHDWTAGAGATAGWRCTASGTPGTWKAEAALSA